MYIMQIITSPTEDWLRARLDECKSRLFISSPYITNILIDIIGEVHKGVEATLLTRTDLREFAVGSSSLDTLCMLANKGISVKSLRGLHAKVYIIDDSSGLISSANATNSGLRSNIECGVAIYDKPFIEDLYRNGLNGFGSNETPSDWTYQDLENLRYPVSIIKSTLPKLPERQYVYPESMRIKVEEGKKFELANSLNGWTALVFEGVISLKSEEFTLDQLFDVCKPFAEKRYPENHHIREKLRQQLQRLRDLGLVDFLGGGNYRCTLDIN